MSKKIIKQTKYCNILEQVKVADNEYTYTVEKIYIKSLRRKELRFAYINVLEEEMKHIFQEV